MWTKVLENNGLRIIGVERGFEISSVQKVAGGGVAGEVYVPVLLCAA